MALSLLSSVSSNRIPSESSKPSIDTVVERGELDSGWRIVSSSPACTFVQHFRMRRQAWLFLVPEALLAQFADRTCRRPGQGIKGGKRASCRHHPTTHPTESTMHFSVFVTLASCIGAAFAAPTSQSSRVNSTTTVTSTGLSAQASTIVSQLVKLNELNAQVAASGSSAVITSAVFNLNGIVDKLVLTRSGGLLGGGSGGVLGGLGSILSGNGGLLKGLSSGEPIGGLLSGALGGNGGGVLSGLLGGGDLFDGLLGGALGSILGGGSGGLLGGILGGGNSGLLSDVTGLLGQFQNLNPLCGPDLLGDILETVEELVQSLTGALGYAQTCGYCYDADLKANLAAVIQANLPKLAPVAHH